MAKLTWDKFVTKHPRTQATYGAAALVIRYVDKQPTIPPLGKNGLKNVTPHGALLVLFNKLFTGDWAARRQGSRVTVVLVATGEDLNRLWEAFPQAGEAGPDDREAAANYPVRMAVYTQDRYWGFARKLGYV